MGLHELLQAPPPPRRRRARPTPGGSTAAILLVVALLASAAASGVRGRPAFVGGGLRGRPFPQLGPQTRRRTGLRMQGQEPYNAQYGGGPAAGSWRGPVARPFVVPPPIPPAGAGANPPYPPPPPMMPPPPPPPPPPHLYPMARGGGAVMDRSTAPPMRPPPFPAQYQQPPVRPMPSRPPAPAPGPRSYPAGNPDGWRGAVPQQWAPAYAPAPPQRPQQAPRPPSPRQPPLAPPSPSPRPRSGSTKSSSGARGPPPTPPPAPSGVPPRRRPATPAAAATKQPAAPGGPSLTPAPAPGQQPRAGGRMQQQQQQHQQQQQQQGPPASPVAPASAVAAPMEFDGQGRRLSATVRQQQEQVQEPQQVPQQEQEQEQEQEQRHREPARAQLQRARQEQQPQPEQQRQQRPQQQRPREAQRSRWASGAGEQQQGTAVPGAVPGAGGPGVELVELRGVVKRITFAAADSGFTVLKVEREEHNDLVTVVGSFPPTNVGAAVSVRGEWAMDARWGRQLRAVEYNETAPATQEGIENYLASGLVRGIGPVAAAQIVGYFGAATLEVLNEAPERLVEVEGIGPKKARMIEQAWRGQKEVTSVMLFLQSHNVSTALATRIYKRYGNASVEVLRRDPYQLADEMEGIGFRTVDKIAAQLGFDPASPTRYRSGLLFLLREQANEGHCYGSRAGLLREGCKLLGAEPAFLEPVLDRMVAAGDLVAHGAPGPGQALFLPFFDMCETQTAYRIQDLMAQPPDALRAAVAGDEARFQRAVERAQKEGGVVFDRGQLQGLRAAAGGRFTVVTGGPGTGKTTMALAIIRLFQGEGAKVVLCAPTGRAAQRLAEGTGLEAKTIHRLLEYSSETRGFGRGPANLLECDALVVDEASMVDVVLMHHLLAALPAQASVVLVGDVDQLPPVGPGNVLRDIIDSGTVEVVRLSTIFRQAERSAIVSNAHRINRGELPELDGGGGTGGAGGKGGAGSSDFFLVEEEDPSKVVEIITDLCTRRIPQRYGVDPVADVQVLCPMKKGEVGTLHLNTVLQRALNPLKEGGSGGGGKGSSVVRYGGREFRVGDKVMQVKNNYEKNVFNGGMGTIVSADAGAKSLGVRFDGVPEPVAYDATELDQIMLAYAATVHKSQGSEYRVVVAPLLLRQHMPMLQRNLLYTCVTRARELLVLVGSRQAIARAVGNDKPAARNSLLHRRLITAKGKPLLPDDDGDHGGDNNKNNNSDQEGQSEGNGGRRRKKG